MGSVSQQERNTVRSRSPLGTRYDTALNRESAAEILQKRAESTAREELREKAEKQSPKRRSNRQSATEAALKSFLRSAFTTLGRELTRGLLGARKRR
ncbi:MAG: DUF853 family protein [Lysobacterales bacterium]